MSYFDQHLKDRPETDYPRRLVQWLIKTFGISKQSLVYDFGCGRGGYTRQWIAAGIVVQGFDLEVDPTLIAVVREADLTQDLLLTPLADVVFSKSVIEHIPDAKTFVKNAYDALSSGGRLLLFTPDWKTSYSVFYDDYTHVRPYSTISLYEALASMPWLTLSVERFWQVKFAWDHPRLFKMFRWIRLFLPHGDLRRRMTNAALFASARKP